MVNDRMPYLLNNDYKIIRVSPAYDTYTTKVYHDLTCFQEKNSIARTIWNGNLMESIYARKKVPKNNYHEVHEYDLAKDGKRFLIDTTGGMGAAAPPPLTVLQRQSIQNAGTHFTQGGSGDTKPQSACWLER
jgi:hypothetical protein